MMARLEGAPGRDESSEQYHARGTGVTNNLSAYLELETPWEAGGDVRLQDITEISPFPLK